MDQVRTYSIGKLAASFGVSAESIRNWEQRLPSLRRTPGGHRRYGAEHIEALARLLSVPVPVIAAGDDHAQ